MATLQDDEKLAFSILAVCDALEEQDTTRAHESIRKARKHAHAVIRERNQPKDKPTCVCPSEQMGPCDCRTECICAE